MESLNLDMLANSLPNSNLVNAEKDLTNNFKAAALSITTLYRSSRRTSKRAYNAGYAAACNDLLFMIQQGVSLSGSSSSSSAASEGVTIGRIMDYAEARLEAIRSREDEEDEDEEREKDKERRPAPTTATATAGPSAPRASLPSLSSTGRSTERVTTRPLAMTSDGTTQSPRRACDQISQLSDDSSSPPISPSIQPTNTSLPPAVTPAYATQSLRQAKAKLASLPPPPASTNIVPFTFNSPLDFPQHSPVTMLPSPAATPDSSTGGKKRRHTAMLESSLPNNPSPVGQVAGGSRRRTRSSRGLALAAQSQNFNQGQRELGGVEDMDVEEEGRERKRVARY